MSFTRAGYLLDGEYCGSSRRERSSFKALRLALEERNAIGALAWPFPFPNSSYTLSLNRILRSQIHQPRSELARFTPPPLPPPPRVACSVCPTPCPWAVARHLAQLPRLMFGFLPQLPFAAFLQAIGFSCAFIARVQHRSYCCRR